MLVYDLRLERHQITSEFPHSQVRQRTNLHDFARANHAVQPQWVHGVAGSNPAVPINCSALKTYGGFGRRLSFRGLQNSYPKTPQTYLPSQQILITCRWRGSRRCSLGAWGYEGYEVGYELRRELPPSGAPSWS